MKNELEILRIEYKRAFEEPLFDSPDEYCIILDLIDDRIREIEERYANY